MVCKKCGELLPEDSEFCQYCGCKIEDAVDAFIEMQVEQTVKTFEENRKSQPNIEETDDFGLVLEKPIYTLASKSVSGEQEYLNKLHTENGVRIKWKRIGSAWADNVNGPVDIYETYLPSGELYKTIYINLYGAEESRKAPAGFILRMVESKTKKERKTKTKFCSRCGAIIDSETKKCTGCGKQYFRGVGKATIGFIVLAVLLAASIAANVAQVIDRQTLDKKLSDLETRRGYWKRTADELQDEIVDLSKDLKEAKEIVDFVNRHVVFVEDDGTKLYHKYSCSRFKADYFWAYNIEAAKGKGYKACSLCN